MFACTAVRGARAAFLLVLAIAPPAARGQNSYPATPAAVVESYCKSDFDGDQFLGEHWDRFVQYATWPDAPGWDSATVVSGYTVTPVWKGSRTARVKVVYHVVGTLDGEDAKAREAAETHVYKLVRRGGRWKVEAPQLRPHVSPGTAITRLENEIKNYPDEADRIRAALEVLRGMAGGSGQ